MTPLFRSAAPLLLLRSALLVLLGLRADGQRPADFWRAALYDPSDDWAGKHPAPRTVRLAGPVATALPAFAASRRFREQYFEKLSVVLEADEGDGPILSPEDTYARDYHYGPPTLGQELFPRNVNFAAGGFHKQRAGRTAPAAPGDVVGGTEIQAALQRGETVFFNDISSWEPRVSEVALGVAKALGLRAAVNAYMTAPGVQTSMATHNDMQCTFVIQMSGVKHWRVWLKSAVMLGTDATLTVGKKPDTQVDVDRLGPPDIETDLRPGQILYVPRGGLHHTSTPAAGGSAPSLHLTLGVNVVRTDPKNDGSAESLAMAKQFSHSVENTAARLVQARSPVATSMHFDFFEQYRIAAETLIRDDPRFRRTLFWPDKQGTKARIKELMHDVVDQMLDGSNFIGQLGEEINGEHEAWRQEQRQKLVDMGGDPSTLDALAAACDAEEEEEVVVVVQEAVEDPTQKWRQMKLPALLKEARRCRADEDAMDAAMEDDAPRESLMAILASTC